MFHFLGNCSGSAEEKELRLIFTSDASIKFRFTLRKRTQAQEKGKVLILVVALMLASLVKTRLKSLQGGPLVRFRYTTWRPITGERHEFYQGA